MAQAKQTKQRVHRAALDDHTECGMPLDKAGITFQPTAGNEAPPSCQRCLKHLTLFCSTCGTDTVRTRTLDRHPVYSSRYPDGEPIEALKCICGHVGIIGHEPVGAKAQQRKLKQQRAEARVHRESAAVRDKEQLADEMAREQAEYPHPDTWRRWQKAGTTERPEQIAPTTLPATASSGSKTASSSSETASSVTNAAQSGQ